LVFAGNLGVAWTAGADDEMAVWDGIDGYVSSKKLSGKRGPASLRWTAISAVGVTRRQK